MALRSKGTQDGGIELAGNDAISLDKNPPKPMRSYTYPVRLRIGASPISHSHPDDCCPRRTPPNKPVVAMTRKKELEPEEP